MKASLSLTFSCLPLLVACSATSPDSPGNISGSSGTTGTSLNNGRGTSGQAGQANLSPASTSAGSGGMSTVLPGSSGGGSDGGASGGGATGGTPAMGGTDAGGAGVGSGGQGAQDLYAPAPRALNVDPSRGNRSIQFRAEDADPNATSFHNGSQTALLNAGSTLQGKLVIGLHGINNGPGPGGAINWAAQRGFHAIMVDYSNFSGGGGIGYLEIWDGQDRTPELDVTPVNSVQHRVESALAYLHEEDLAGDWGYYLNADGTVRWSDVIVFGYSFGGQTAAAASKLVPLHRAIATAAPGLDATAEWVLAEPVMPPERGFAIFDQSDGAERKTAACIALGWGTEAVNADTVPPPYNNGQILIASGGHSEFCSRPEFDAVCEYAFGLTQ